MSIEKKVLWYHQHLYKTKLRRRSRKANGLRHPGLMGSESTTTLGGSNDSVRIWRVLFDPSLWGGFKGVIHFPWILSNAEFSPWKRLPESGSHKKVCSCFRDSQWRHGFLFLFFVYRLCHVPEIKPYILSWGHSVFARKEKKFWRFVSRSDIPKFQK